MFNVITQPCSNKIAQKHYQRTIDTQLPLESLRSFLTNEDYIALKTSFTNGFVKAWGITPTSKNKDSWNKINIGDIALFYAHKILFSKAIVVRKIHNPKLAEYLWDTDSNGKTWEFMYFLDELELININIEDFNKTMGYKPNYIIQGLNIYQGKKGDNLAFKLNLYNNTCLPEFTPKELEQSIEKEFDCRKSIEQVSSMEDTDLQVLTTNRKEQAILRKVLLKNQKVIKCGICGKEYPAEFIVASHIKKRALCSKEERLDIENIAMPMCKFGCDNLFESGYIYVENGIIKYNETRATTNDLKNYLQSINGKRCHYYTDKSKKYFTEHQKIHLINTLK